MFEHSKAKVRLLEAYLTEYLPVISNDGYTEAIHFFDMFCGEGTYPNGGEGSPLVIGRMLGDLCRGRTGLWIPKLHFTWNDIDKSKVAQVGETLRTSAVASYPNVSLTQSNRKYSDIFDVAVECIKGLSSKQKAFLFIDPYGYKDVKPEHIRELLQGGRSELLLFQPTQHRFRFAEKGRPPALTDFMLEMSDGNEWPAGLSVLDYIRHTTELFRSYLGDAFFVDTFIIQKDAPKAVFCLFFFSPHIRGFEKMLNAKWKMDADSGQGWHYHDSMQGFDLFDQPQTNPLELYLERRLRTRLSWSNGELYEMILRQGFLPKHGREVLTLWQQSGKIQVSPPTRKGAFYLSYKDFKEQPLKVQVSLTS